MKKLLIVVSVFAAGMAANSCKKSVNASSGATTTLEISSADKIEWRDVNGNLVNPEVCKNDEDGHLLLENKNGLKITHFENPSQALVFAAEKGKEYDAMAYGMTWALNARAIAIKNGDDLLTGDNPTYSKEFTDFLATHKLMSINAKGTGVLWDNSNNTGTSRPLTSVPLPTYGGFNNKAESLNVVGISILWRKTIFRGGSLFVNTIGSQNLNNSSFGNDMESTN